MLDALDALDAFHTGRFDAYAELAGMYRAVSGPHGLADEDDALTDWLDPEGDHHGRVPAVAEARAA